MVPSWSRAKASRCWIRRAIRSPSMVTLRISAAAAPPARSPSATVATRRSASRGSRPTAGCAGRGALLVEPDLLHPAVGVEVVVRHEVPHVRPLRVIVEAPTHHGPRRLLLELPENLLDEGEALLRIQLL